MKDRNLFHRVDTIGNIFTSGEEKHKYPLFINIASSIERLLTWRQISISALHSYDHWLGQYSFHGLVIVIAKGFIPLSHPCPLFRRWLCGKAASGVMLKKKKKKKKSKYRCTGRHSLTKIILGTALKKLNHTIYMWFSLQNYVFKKPYKEYVEISRTSYQKKNKTA